MEDAHRGEDAALEETGEGVQWGIVSCLIKIRDNSDPRSLDFV